jgi:hypothetical protein
MKIRDIYEGIVNISGRIKCIYDIITQEIEKILPYIEDDAIGDKWFELRGIKNKIEVYLRDGFFSGSDKTQMSIFVYGLNYSDRDTYSTGKYVGMLPDSDDIKVYTAIGDKVLFRGVSVEDWERIQHNGFIDSDMRGAISSSEGINLAQTPSTAENYLPHNDTGVILAITPKGLDLYILSDGYIRVFEPIPIENIIKVSSTIRKNKQGTILTNNTDGKFEEIIHKLKLLDIDINC